MMRVFPKLLALLATDPFFQQTAANADQVKDIEERVQSLGEVLASQVGDRDKEEKARRKALRKFEPSHSRIKGTSLNPTGCPQ